MRSTITKLPKLPKLALAGLLLAPLALALAPAGCGSDPVAPDGYRLVVQLENVSVTAVDQLRITFTPDATMGAVGFQDIEPVTYEDGGITVDVESDGVLVMTLTGDYVRANADVGEPTSPRIALEIWSDDEMMRRGPQVRATVTRAAEQIATGAFFLPGWPLPLGSDGLLRVPCRMGFEAQCMP